MSPLDGIATLDSGHTTADNYRRLIEITKMIEKHCGYYFLYNCHKITLPVIRLTLQTNTHVAAIVKIYKIIALTHRSKLNIFRMLNHCAIFVK